MKPQAITGLLTLCLFAACTPKQVDNPHFFPMTVVHPDANDVANDPGWSKDAEGHMVVHIEFSRDVQRDTVEQGNSLWLVTPRQTLFTVGTCVWKSDKELDFVTAQTYEWLVPTPNYDTIVTLTLNGTRANENFGTFVIRDKSGHALDGDNDGVEGGNYTRRLVIPVY
jgi:hypothetical protein